jgi:hypothetical protein
MRAMSGGSAIVRYVIRADKSIEVQQNDLGKIARIRGIAGRFATDVHGGAAGGTNMTTQSHASDLRILTVLTDGAPTLVRQGVVCKFVAALAACIFVLAGDGDEGPGPIEPGGGTTTSQCHPPPCR